jgi:DNA-binding transcriptional ArsR family regulator
MLPDDMDAVFQALGNRDRRRMLDLVRNNPGCCVEELGRHFAFGRIAVLKHLKVLDRAGLIVSQREGRKRALYFNVVPIQLIFDRWATEYSALWAGKLADLKYTIEGDEAHEREAKRRGSTKRRA